MELMLQFGWGMMEHCRFLVRHWGGGTVILSPRDLSAEQMGTLATNVTSGGGSILLDPQLYVPECTHPRLTAHAFWPRLPEYWRDPGELSRVIDELIKANAACRSAQFICPSPFLSSINDESLRSVSAAVEELERRGLAPDHILATVALSSDAVRNEDRAEMLSDAIEGWNIGGIYLIAEHPSSEYLVSDPMWIARILDIVAGARLAGKTVVIGYSSHQMLVAASAGATAIASGSWLNVRQFSPTRFDEPNDDEISRRATWYYAPHLLSEFKLQFLDIVWRLGQLPTLHAPAGIDGVFAEALFSGTQPTTADFGESSAFRHYLHCLRQQVSATRKATFQETILDHVWHLDLAEAELKTLAKARIVSKERGFLDAVDANRAALTVLEATRGPILSREWTSI
jgi:hypothetical protein